MTPEREIKIAVRRKVIKSIKRERD